MNCRIQPTAHAGGGLLIQDQLQELVCWLPGVAAKVRVAYGRWLYGLLCEPAADPEVDAARHASYGSVTLGQSARYNIGMRLS